MRLGVLTSVVLMMLFFTHAYCTDCTANGGFARVSRITRNPDFFENKEIKVIGYLRYNVAIIPFLYGSKKDALLKNFSSGLDAAIPDSVYRPDAQMVENGHCVMIVGRLVRYSRKTIKLDYISSPTGKIVADSLTLVDCSNGQRQSGKGDGG